MHRIPIATIYAGVAAAAAAAAVAIAHQIAKPATGALPGGACLEKKLALPIMHTALSSLNVKRRGSNDHPSVKRVLWFLRLYSVGVQYSTVTRHF